MPVVTGQGQSLDKALSDLDALLVRMGVGNVTLLELVASYLEKPGQQQIGYAFLKHGIDVLNEEPDAHPRRVLGECYRRIFWDKEGAERYGTSPLFMSPEMAVEMVKNLALQHDAVEQGAPIHPEAAGLH